jgi:magnesium transporter
VNSERIPDLSSPVREVERTEPVRLLATETASQAMARMRGEQIGERIIYFYVTAPDGKLLGVVPTRRLILSDPDALIRDIMVQPAVYVGEDDTFGHALEVINSRRLLALLVVDSAGRLSGVLDFSVFTQGLLDLERRDTADEFFQIVGLRIEEEKRRSVMGVFGKRFPWLLLNVASGLIAASVSGLFDQALKAVVAVAFFIPLILTLAESVAMQTVAISLMAVRAPSGRRDAEAWRVFREMRVGLLLGFTSGAVVGLIAFGWLRLPHLAAVIAAAVFTAGGIGASLGYVVPLVVRRLHLDPKIASGPAVLALTDIAAIFFYLQMASLALK